MEPERGGFGACTAGSHLRYIPFEFPVVEYGMTPKKCDANFQCSR